MTGIISRNSNSTLERFPAEIVSQIVQWLDVIDIKDVLLAVPSWRRFAIVIKDVYQKDGCHVPRYPLWFELPGVEVVELDDVSDYGRLSPLPVIRLLEVYWYSKKNYLNDTLERFLTTDRRLFNNNTFVFFYGRNVTGAQQTIEYVMNSIDATLFQRNKALVGTTWDFDNIDRGSQSVVRSVSEVERLPMCHHLSWPLCHLYNAYSWLPLFHFSDATTSLISLVIEGVDVVQNLRLPMLTHLRVSFTVKAVGPPIIRRVRLPRLQYMRIHFRDVALPLLYDIDVATLSVAEPVFDLTDPTAVLATKPPVQDRHTRIQDYEEHQDLIFLSVFHTVVVIGVPDFFVRRIPFLELSNFVWYKTRQYDEDVPIQKVDNFRVLSLSLFTFYTNIPHATAPSFEYVIGVERIHASYLTVFTTAPYTDINDSVSRCVVEDYARHPVRWEISLVCRLSATEIGGPGHLTLSTLDVRAIQRPRNGEKFSYHLEGCFLGEQNRDMTDSTTEYYSPRQASRKLSTGTVSPRTRLMASSLLNIILVRHRDGEVYGPWCDRAHFIRNRHMAARVLDSLQTRLVFNSVFAIGQVKARGAYVPWRSMSLINPHGPTHMNSCLPLIADDALDEPVVWWC